ncbi:MAG: polysaccharide deacetylase family protein [Lachnospiraceae bacterium]|nr:polysaccharide deacetylase family protein [Lachnospiraceae bacterium]
MKKIIFTVDVEGHVGNDPVSALIWGKDSKNEQYGIDLLMNMLDEFKIKGLFFVDVAEAWHYGSETIMEVMRHIHERGHLVGVHIHPDHMADKKRLFLGEYSYDEQFDIIKKCTNFYVETLGVMPKYFRSGKYSGNWDTLKILTELGYSIDFSEFYGQKWCKISPECTISNSVRLDSGMLEIPVTTYMSIKNKHYSRFDKIDATMTFSEFKYIFNNLLKHESYNVLVLFAHSFSMINWRKNPNNPSFSKKKYKQLYKQLDYVCNKLNLAFNDLENEALDGFATEGNGTYFCSKGIRTWYYLFIRFCSVVKSKIDIRFRKLK